jgi:predicted permease
MRDFGGVENSARDMAYAVRVLRRNAGFTAAVVLTFALGIGCTSAIFSLVNGMLLRPLPYQEPSRLVVLWERNASRGADRNVVSVQNFEAWRDRARSFSSVAALVPAPMTLAGSPTERMTGAQVSASYFGLLGVRPMLGRDFAPGDESNGGAPVTMLSNALWRTRFGADPAVVGRTIVLDDHPYLVIGVMPASFDPPHFGWMAEQPFWLPFAPTADNRSWGRVLHVVARLKPGVSIESARAEMGVLGERLAHESENDRGWSTSVVSLAEQITGDVRTPLLVLLSAVSLLLAMSAVNVANLTAAFMRRRHHELTVRRALGATPFRLLRQQMAQSILLGALGTAVGLAVAVGATRMLVHLMPPDVPRLAGVRVDGAVVLFLSIVACVTTLLVGGVAVFRGMRPAPSPIGGASVGRTTARLGGSRIVTAEMAIGLVLTVLAVLMVRTLVNLRSVDLGFQAASVVTGRVSLPGSRYENPDQQRAFFDALLMRLRATPGVTAASIATTRPFACCAPATTVRDAARPGDALANAPTTDVRFVDSSYFAALQLPILAGRGLSQSEAREGQARAVVSRRLARSLWGAADPIGRSVTMTLFGSTTAVVIGVAADIHLADPRTAPRPALFLSTARFPSAERDVVVRGSADPTQLLVALRNAVSQIDASVPLYRATSLAAAVSAAVAQDRFTTLLLAAFAVLSLLLAAVGVYGVLSGDVARRRKEIGIRLALGARTSSVTGLVIRGLVGPVLSGVAIGVAVALVLTRSMSALVFGVATSDIGSFAAVAGILLVVAGIAALAPVLRATRVSPLEAIRTD